MPSNGPLKISSPKARQSSSSTSSTGPLQLHVCGKANNSLGGLDGLGGGAANVVLEKPTKDLFLTFHCFCTRKDLLCFDMVLEDTDIARAITEYAAHAAIENLVLGASRHGFIRRLKTVDVPTNISKSSPDFCTVYAISKLKISSLRNDSRSAPFASPLMPALQQMQDQSNQISSVLMSPSARMTPRHLPNRVPDRTPRKATAEDTESTKSPFLARGYNPNMFMDLTESDTDISFISSDRPSTDNRIIDPQIYDGIDTGRNSRVSLSSEGSFESICSGSRFNEMSPLSEYSTASMDDVEAEMRRLKIELQKITDMYSTACKEALTAKQKTVELHQWRMEEERRLEEVRRVEEAAQVKVEQEKAKYKISLENAEAAHRIALLESQKRVEEEKKAIQNSDNKDRLIKNLRYRRYTIEEIEEATEFFNHSRKIGEGGYGPVYKCSLDHTSVAIKVLRP